MSEQHSGSAKSLSTLVVRDLIAELTETLKLGGVAEARRAAHDVITGILDAPRSWGIRNADVEVEPSVATEARKAVRMIIAGAPLFYAVGRAPFRHLTLRVDTRVLIPRPETELLVDIVLRHFRTKFRTASDWGIAVDIGTGSGAIALSLASEGKFVRMIATDSSLDALSVAKANADSLAPALNCPVEFRSGSLLAPVADVRAKLLVSNPPYISFEEIGQLPSSVRSWEPPTALFSSRNGLDATAAIVQKGH
ncbi:MAG TPA: HemK/PrmC family methyltransferase, partial [Gemmatimonadaceae bacterium]|nr:HemK/PrmC family methyltransferase [Gemmatimonadaceae bacterium]